MTDPRTRHGARALLLALVLGLVAAGCTSGSEPDPMIPVRATADAWVDALGRGDLPAAAQLTDTPVAAQQTLQQVFSGLGAEDAKF